MKWSLGHLHKTFALSALPVQREGFSTKKIPCCWILKNEDEGIFVKLNDSSMTIWQMCTGEQTVGEIIDSLQTQFPEVDGIDKDIQRALDELKREQLISI